MKPESSWSFSTALAHVDLGRICDEAADVYGTLGAVKIVVEVSKREACCLVLADSNLCAHAGNRIETLPVSVLTIDSALKRAQGGLACGPGISCNSFDGGVAVLKGGAILAFSCEDEKQADRLVAQLVDRVVVRVEAF